MVRYSGNSEAAPASGGERVPPYSEEAEQGVLGSILLDFERALNLAVDSRITPDTFYTPRHRIIFEAMINLLGSGQAIDQVTLSSYLSTHGLLEKAGGNDYIQQLVDSTPTAAHAEFYIDIIRQKFLLREIIKCSQNAENACYTGERNADELLGQVEQDFLNITENQHGEIVEWPDAVREVMQHIETVFQNKSSIDNGVSSGFHNIDKQVRCLRCSEMIVLAARPSMGKTSLAMNIAENVALGKLAPDNKPHAVGIFSLEMSYMSLVTRMLCCRAKVSGSQLAGGFLSRELHGSLVQAASVLSKAPMYIDDTGGLDVMELRARARRMKKKYGIELIVIDYLQLLNCREYARQGRQLETSAISANLKAMAKELNLPVLVLSQLSRAPEQRGKDTRPKLSDLRDSGAIEQDADVVMMLRRPCYYPGSEGSEDETLAILEVVKQRNGPTGEVFLNFENSYTRFTDRAHGVDGYNGEGVE